MFNSYRRFILTNFQKIFTRHLMRIEGFQLNPCQSSGSTREGPSVRPSIISKSNFFSYNSHVCILLEAIIQVFTLLFRASNCSQNSKEASKLCTFQKRAQKRELPSIQKRKLRVWVNDSLQREQGLEFSVHLFPLHVVTSDASHWNYHSFWLCCCLYFTEYFIRTGLVVIYLVFSQYTFAG